MPLSILLVDDEPGLPEAMADVLRMERHVVSIAHDGNAALGLARTHEFDLVISDAMMPVVPGLELLLRFRTNGPPGSWLVLMSAAPPPPALPDNIRFMPKPVGAEALAHLATECETSPEIRARRARRGLRIVPRQDADP